MQGLFESDFALFKSVGGHLIKVLNRLDSRVGEHLASFEKEMEACSFVWQTYHLLRFFGAQ